ncbi:MAG: hypothetical protein GKC03_07610 [Methanomassiliicoccales archaeon]|nr:hypothetical protein [Methanomassiliicoccales archaeon]NYT16128.1 hypothetical protein [Methanomassiliicoccales archaeon]
MKAADLLDLPDIKFIEPNFESLVDNSYTSELLRIDAEESILLVDENEWPLAFGVFDGQKWIFANFLLRQPPRGILDAFEQIGGRIFQEDWEVWNSAVMEYYSLMLLRDTTPAIEDFSVDRMNQIVTLIKEVWGIADGTKCLDVGCGSGMGSVALRRLGYSPLAYDNDPSQLALGMISGRLDPSETLCIDGTIASRYISPTPKGLCLMAGTIDHTASWFWKEIIDQMLVIADEVLVTVGMEKESDFVSEWANDRGRTVEVFENQRDPFYDRWVCVIGKREGPDQ